MYKIIILLSLLIPISLSASEPSRNDLVGQALVDYGKVAGGWFISQRCDFLSPEQAASFKSDVVNITVALGKDLGSPAMLYQVQQSAKTSTDSEKYSGCGERNKDIVTAVTAQAKAWSEQIIKLQSAENG